MVNIVTGEHDVLTKTLAEHEEVGALWYFGKADGVKTVEAASISNVKQTWTHNERAIDWLTAHEGIKGRTHMQKATQVKNIWVPYGA